LERVTFPFPPGFEPSGYEKAPARIDPKVWERTRKQLDSLGSRLDTDRREIMQKLDIGLTKLYNLYHDPQLSPAAVIKEPKCAEEEAAWAIARARILAELLKLNHQRHAEEVAAGLADEKGKPTKKNGVRAKKSNKKDQIQGELRDAF